MPRQAITMMSWLITAWHVAYDIKIYGYTSLSVCVCVCDGLGQSAHSRTILSMLQMKR